MKRQNSDQHQINRDLQKQIDELKAMIVSIQSTPVLLNAGANSQQSTVIPSASLEQNAPNPFNNNTVIKYYLPAKTNHAELVITDTKGHTLKTISISNKGAGQATISANTLSPGSYFYSLIIDGKKIDTKQMELLK